MTQSSELNNSISMIGAGGHAYCLYSCLSIAQKKKIKRVVSHHLPKFNVLTLLEWFNDETSLIEKEQAHKFINGIGANPSTNRRREIFNFYKSNGFSAETVISKHAIISDDVVIGEGAQILPGAIINTGAIIGANAIINSGAIIEHGVHIASHCHVAPGAIILGDAEVGEGTFLGAGSVVFPGIRLDEENCIAALSRVTKDIINR